MKYTRSELARVTEGKLSGKYILLSGPDHSSRDSSLSIWPSPQNGDGFGLHSFAGDDPLKCREYVKELIKANKDVKKMPSRISKPKLKLPEQSGPTEYIYYLADGSHYLRVQRTEPKGRFLQSHWTGSSWVTGKPSGPKIPYRLPELLKAPAGAPVFICEGEKDADNLAGLGLTATTNSEGAGKWTAELNRWFAGRIVYILPDNDEAGAKHAQKLLKNLTGIAAEVKIVVLPGLPAKGDVTDWLSQGRSATELIELCEISRSSSPQQCILASELQGKEFEPVREIVAGYIPEGVTILAGKPKSHKSWLVLQIGIAVASGGTALGTRCNQGDALYVALEDGEKRVQKRMQKLLGTKPWPSRLEFRWTLPRLNEGGVGAVRQWLVAARAPRLVVIDTLGMVRDPRGREQSVYEADYQAISGLKGLADEFGVAIVLVHHLRKMTAEDPLDAVSGSTGLTGAADTVLVLTRDGQGRKLQGRGRDIESIDKAVEFDSETACWRILGDADEVHRSDERRRVLACFEDGSPLTTAEIIERAELNPSSVRMMLSRMVKAGELKREGRGRYVKAVADTCDTGYNGYKLQEDTRSNNVTDVTGQTPPFERKPLRKLPLPRPRVVSGPTGLRRPLRKPQAS